MTAEYDNRTKACQAAYELIDTEKTYLSRLEAVDKVFISQLQDFKIIDANDFELQFGCWSTLLGICRRFYACLENQRKETYPLLGKIMDEFCEDPDFFIYQVYLVKFESALNRRAVLMTTNRKFSQFVIDAQSDPRTFGFTIESLLIEPVARVPRYCLLLEQLIKYTPKYSNEYNLLTKSFYRIKSITSENNEAIQQRENKEKIMSIMMTVDNKTRVNLLDDNDRQYIREGILERQCRRNKKEFMFWLFSDKLLYGELSSSSAFSRSRNYTLHRVINLYETCVVHEVHGINEKPENAFMIMSKSKSFILWAKNTDEKASWCKDIDAAITNLQTVGKFNHHTKYAPVWIPDAFVQTCMECDVSFTTLRRKHHCRLCGTVVCNDCSKNRIFAENIDQHHEVRVCDTCMSKGTPQTDIMKICQELRLNIYESQTIKTHFTFTQPLLVHTATVATTATTTTTTTCMSITDDLNSIQNDTIPSTTTIRYPSYSDTRSSIESGNSTEFSVLSVHRLTSFSRNSSTTNKKQAYRPYSKIDSFDLKAFLIYRSAMLDQINPNRRQDSYNLRHTEVSTEPIELENDHIYNDNFTNSFDTDDSNIPENSLIHMSENSNRVKCRLCTHTFSLFRNKRTCGNCGSNVCPDCSQKKFMIPYINVKHPVRVCDDCYIVLSHGLGSTYEPYFRNTTTVKPPSQRMTTVMDTNTPLEVRKSRDRLRISVDDRESSCINDVDNDLETSLRKQYYRDLSPVKRIQMLSREVREASITSLPFSNTSICMNIKSQDSSAGGNNGLTGGPKFLNNALNHVMSFKGLNVDNSRNTIISNESNNKMSKSDGMYEMEGTVDGIFKKSQSLYTISNISEDISLPYNKSNNNHLNKRSESLYESNTDREFSTDSMDSWKEDNTYISPQIPVTNKLSWISPSNKLNSSPNNLTRDVMRYLSRTSSKTNSPPNKATSNYEKYPSSLSSSINTVTTPNSEPLLCTPSPSLSHSPTKMYLRPSMKAHLSPSNDILCHSTDDDNSIPIVYGTNNFISTNINESLYKTSQEMEEEEEEDIHIPVSFSRYINHKNDHDTINKNEDIYNTHHIHDDTSFDYNQSSSPSSSLSFFPFPTLTKSHPTSPIIDPEKIEDSSFDYPSSSSGHDKEIHVHLHSKSESDIHVHESLFEKSSSSSDGASSVYSWRYTEMK